MDYKSLIKSELEIKKIDIASDLIDTYISKAKAYIKRHCNIEEIPEELDFVIVDMAVMMIENKYSTIQAEKEVKSKTMGDTSVTYNTVTRKELNYDEIVGQFSSELNAYRCLKW